MHIFQSIAAIYSWQLIPLQSTLLDFDLSERADIFLYYLETRMQTNSISRLKALLNAKIANQQK